MLSASKNALEATLNESLVKLQNQELMFYQNNFASIATMATFIGGFAFGALFTNEDSMNGLLGHNRELEVCFYLLACVTIGAMMWCVISCTMLNIYGPNLALRGPDGSLTLAVDKVARVRGAYGAAAAAGGRREGGLRASAPPGCL